MSKTPPGVMFVCPNCHHLVDPSKPNAMMSAATKQWQHTDCWRVSAPVVPPDASKTNPRRA